MVSYIGPYMPASPARSLRRGAANRRRNSPQPARTPRTGTLLLEELDAKAEPTWAEVRFSGGDGRPRPHPLRFIKQVITMLLATSPPELSTTFPQLGDFVRNRDAVGLPDRFQFYLALFAGPLARSTGVAGRMNADGRFDTLVEVAYPPFAYVLTMDSADDEAIPTANITAFTNVGYNATADLEMSLLIGFGHTPLPTGYRTEGMIQLERALDEPHLLDL